MKLNIKKLLQQPEVKELAITLIGLSAGFAANKLINMLIKRNMVADLIGKAVQVGVTSWVASHPEWIEDITDRFLPENTA